MLQELTEHSNFLLENLVRLEHNQLAAPSFWPTILRSRDAHTP